MKRHKLVGLLRHVFTGGLLFYATSSAVADANLWIRDDALDVGDEPNTTSPLYYVSDDIWVRRTADPNFDPRPFPDGSPTWVPLPHEGPCYRDPKASSPNYIYVRVRNRGDTTSSGTETLHVHWAKASTGLVWPDDWNDHLATPCGGTPRLYGFEVTKPRKNGAIATASEIADYVDAVQQINTASFQFPDGRTYFEKQNDVHYTIRYGTGVDAAHGTLRFEPWHREMMNRYEILLREVHPALTLLYWDWTTDPVPAIIGPAGFMGAANGVVGAPFPTFGVTRNKRPGSPGAYSPGLTVGFQNTLLGKVNYSAFIDPTWTHGGIEGQAHNSAHCYAGGFIGMVPGTLCSIEQGAEDPLFFMLHANVDRLWSQWQRQDVRRWTPSMAYDLSQGDGAITSDMQPWAGGDVPNGVPALSPWINQNPMDPNGYVIHKTPLSHSVIAPPAYDDSPLTIPPIPPGYSCIIEVPFYPPPIAECGGFVDPQHLCLLARILPLTAPELNAVDVGVNVRANNKIAWKNVTLGDCNIGPFFALIPWRIGAAGEIVKNIRTTPAKVTLRFDEAPISTFSSLFDYGKVRVRLEDNLYKAWIAGGGVGQGIEPVKGTSEILVGQSGAFIAGLPLGALESGRVDVALELNRGYQAPFGAVYHLDLLQFDDLGGDKLSVGGQRFDLDFNQLAVTRQGAVWKYLDGGVAPAGDWSQPTFDDTNWKTGMATFGRGGQNITTGLVGTNSRAVASSFYFRQSFGLKDPGYLNSLGLNLLANDGFIVYLNGKEVARQNMPTGPVTPQTPAITTVTGAAARAYHSVDLGKEGLALLVPGQNLIAVEVHTALQRTNLQSDTVTFDLGLVGNFPTYPHQPPSLLVNEPGNGAIVKADLPVQINADVFAPDSNVDYVQILLDGRLSSTLKKPPYVGTFYPVTPGAHRVSIVANDLAGHTTRMESVFTAVDNLPPSVEMTDPLGKMYAFGDPITLRANASDPDGSIARVNFFVATHRAFGEQVYSGASTNPPYSVVVTGLAPGMYMATAQAIDNLGLPSYSSVAHFMVNKPTDSPLLEISSGQAGNDFLIGLEWSIGGTLYHTSDLSAPKWKPIPNAQSPYIFKTTGGSDFFKLTIPKSANACGCGTSGSACNCGSSCNCSH